MKVQRQRLYSDTRYNRERPVLRLKRFSQMSDLELQQRMYAFGRLGAGLTGFKRGALDAYHAGGSLKDSISMGISRGKRATKVKRANNLRHDRSDLANSVNNLESKSSRLGKEIEGKTSSIKNLESKQAGAKMHQSNVEQQIRDKENYLGQLNTSSPKSENKLLNKVKGLMGKSNGKGLKGKVAKTNAKNLQEKTTAVKKDIGNLTSKRDAINSTINKRDSQISTLGSERSVLAGRKQMSDRVLGIKKDKLNRTDAEISNLFGGQKSNSAKMRELKRNSARNNVAKEISKSVPTSETVAKAQPTFTPPTEKTIKFNPRSPRTKPAVNPNSYNFTGEPSKGGFDFRSPQIAETKQSFTDLGKIGPNSTHFGGKTQEGFRFDKQPLPKSKTPNNEFNFDGNQQSLTQKVETKTTKNRAPEAPANKDSNKSVETKETNSSNSSPSTNENTNSGNSNSGSDSGDNKGGLGTLGAAGLGAAGLAGSMIANKKNRDDREREQ